MDSILHGFGLSATDLHPRKYSSAAIARRVANALLKLRQGSLFLAMRAAYARMISSRGHWKHKRATYFGAARSTRPPASMRLPDEVVLAALDVRAAGRKNARKIDHVVVLRCQLYR